MQPLLERARWYGVFWSIATAMAIRLVPQEQAVKVTSIVLGGLALAAVLGVPLGTLIGQLAGWHTAFAVLSVLSAAVCVVALPVIPPMPPQVVAASVHSLPHSATALSDSPR